MTTVIVPTSVLQEIDDALDREFGVYPDAARYRDLFRGQLLNHVYEFGMVPDFSLEKKGGGENGAI